MLAERNLFLSELQIELGLFEIAYTMNADPIFAAIVWHRSLIVVRIDD